MSVKASRTASGPSRLEIHVNLVDGSVSKFLQDDSDAIQKILDGFSPNTLFDQPYLIIETPTSVAIFPSKNIARIEIHLDKKPTWKPRWKPRWANRIAKIKDVTAEFGRRVPDYDDLPLSHQRRKKPGDRFHGFGYIRLANKEEIILEVNTRLADEVTQKSGLHAILGESTIFFPKAGGGFSFINTANIVRLELLPGQPEVAPNAWPARPI